MTERKPSGMSFESWIDKQIREATERGAFDNLPGAGKPLAGAGRSYENDWWLKDWLRREGAEADALLPTPLRLRKRIDQLPVTVRKLRTEEQVRAAIAEVNDEVRAWWRSSIGPQIHIALVSDATTEEIVERWRSERAVIESATSSVMEKPRPQKRWWRLRRAAG